MYGIETIKAMNSDAAERARSNGTEPALIWHISQIGKMPPFPFPHIGDACDDIDKTHERITTLFCDASGFGEEGDPALTVTQTRDRLLELIAKHGAIRGAVEEAGQFQVRLAIWKA